MTTAKYTIKDFHREFPDDDTCLDYLFHARWPDGVNCPTCQRATNHYRVGGRKGYSCANCGRYVFPTADTIFHKSATPLTLWFHAVFLMASTRCGISAKQLQRELGVTYKTAWRMFHQIRKLMGADPQGPLGGEVEADETYVGGFTDTRMHLSFGKERGRHSREGVILLGCVCVSTRNTLRPTPVTRPPDRASESPGFSIDG